MQAFSHGHGIHMFYCYKLVSQGKSLKVRNSDYKLTVCNYKPKMMFTLREGRLQIQDKTKDFKERKHSFI